MCDPTYNPKPSDGRVLNHYLLQHKQVQKKLNDILGYVKKHDDALFRGLTIQNVNKFQHAFNTKHMLSIKDKVAKVDESIDCLEPKQEKFKVLFKGFKASMSQRNENRKRASTNPEQQKRGD